MPLHGYGVLIGKIVASRPPRGANPHWLLFVQPADAGHPPYRVAVNVETKDGQSGASVEYQADVDLMATNAGQAFVKQLQGLGQTSSFLSADADPNVPRLDLVHGVVDPKAFKAIAPGTTPYRTAFEKALAKAKQAGTLLAVFGTGYPVNQKTGEAPGTGFVGVDNIHMNQGNRHVTGGTEHYLENGPKQDGGLIFITAKSARGFFTKFASQTSKTDQADGRPVDTGIAKIDRVPLAVRKEILPAPAAAAPAPAKPPLASARTKGAPAVAPVKAAPPADGKFVFADPDPGDANAAFAADNDAGTFKTPYVVTRSRGTTRGPVPTPRRYPTLDFKTVVASSPGYTSTADGESIAFDLVGDSGAPSQAKLPGELSVTRLMVRDAAKAPPAFLFHLGDVVYFYGEKDYYYSQFYEPFQQYPAPIFAIPGNHDGITYGPDMVSLDPFQKAFCAETPGRWEGSAGILRSTMIQPGVYFTLDAPLVSIIGLYSNCGESLGWLDGPQLLFLYNELVRLKALRAKEGRAVVLAIHHCPRWFPNQAKPDATSVAIDQACTKAGFWPDAVVCGHAHLYQRIVRKQGARQTPYIIAGAGGYGLNPMQVTAKDYVATLDPTLTRLLVEEGYVRATVTKPKGKNGTLRLEYRSVKQTSDQPDDVWTVKLT